MPWVKLSDDWYDDPAIVQAGDDGGWLWVVALSWSARNLTDGHIPSRQLSRLTTLDDPHSVAGDLCSLGLFRRDEERGGWVIANYHRYQPTAAEVKAKREAEAARKRKSRGVSGGSPAGRDAESVSPGPGPVPVDPSSSSAVSNEGCPQGGDEDDRFSRLVDVLAQHRLEANRSEVRNPHPWLARTRANLIAESGDELRALVDEFPSEHPRNLAEVFEGKRPKGSLRREAS